MERRHLEGGGGGGKPSPKRSVTQWIPLQQHPVFSIPRPSAAGNLTASGGGSNLTAWDAATSRLYVWDPDSRFLHRLSLRFIDADPDSSSSSAAVAEAASPSEILMPAIQIKYAVHNISLNIDGTSLLLAGSNNVNLMYLNGRISRNDDTVTYRTITVGSQIFFGHDNGLQILRVSWHPYSSTHLGILSSDSVFRLFDFSSDLEQPEQEYYLQPVESGTCRNAVSICPVSFSFGGQHLWDGLSVFILFSDGSVYILCPVVPFGSLYSSAYIEEIYEDANMFGGLKSSNPEVFSNSSLAIAWLEATFPEIVDRPLEGGNTLVLRARPYALLDSSISLQGPLVKIWHGDKNVDSDLTITDLDCKAIGFLYSSISKDSVLVIAWSSGKLQIDALAEEVQPSWKVGSPRLRFDSNNSIGGVAMICEINSQKSSADNISMGDAPTLLNLAIIDLALPKFAASRFLLSLFSDPLISERFYCLHGGGVDLVSLHFLPFSNPAFGADKNPRSPTVSPILSTSIGESTSPSFLYGFVSIADSFGHSAIVGLTSSYECIVLEMKSWNEEVPLQYDIVDMDVKSIGSTEAVVPDILSKEVLTGPKRVPVPPITFRSLTADSVEGRAALHHYIQIFHEIYVEYGHKVYIELKYHGDYLKSVLDDQQRRIREAKQLLLNCEAKESSIHDRITWASKVYELLQRRLQNFNALPVANKKPLSRAEQEFKTQLDGFADLELGALRSSIEALNARLKRNIQSSSVTASNSPRRTPGRARSQVADSQMSQLKSSLEALTRIADENTNKVKLIEQGLKSLEL